MQVVLARRLNKRLIELHHSTQGETVGLLRKDGTYGYFPWLGFLLREKAFNLGKPVKLEIARIGWERLSSVEWRDIPKGKHVQGCLTERGAYAVIAQDIRIV